MTIAFLFTIVFVETAGAQWLQWGGPTRDFKSPETGLLDKWPDQGLRPLWVDQSTGNYATAIVDGNVVYSLYTARDDEEKLLGLDVESGLIVWYFRNAAPAAKAQKLDFGRGPNATPIVHDGRVIFVGFTGQMWCFTTADTEYAWTHDLVKEFDAKVHEFGYSISPIIYNDNVVTLTGGKKQGAIAFRYDTGSVVWKSAPFDVSYASPILIKVDGQDQLVVMSSTEVIGLDPQNGKVLWRYPHANNFKNNCSTPVWGDDNLLLISSHADGGSRVLRLKQKGGKTDVREVWHSKEVRFFHSTPIRIGDFVYGSSGDQPPTFFTAVNVKTGKIAWKERGFNKATCTYADGKMYILDEDGKLTLAKVSPEKMTVISSFKPLEKTAWAAPTIANGRLFVRDQNKIMAFDIAKKR